MSNIPLEQAVREICQACGNDRTRLMDICRAVQNQFGCVSGEAMDLIARECRCPRVEVESVVSFYAFFSDKPKGKIIIRLCDDIVDRLHGYDRVAKALSQELGIAVGQTTSCGGFTLERTPCIGMCDQAPAAMVNDVIVTKLNAASAREMIKELREHMDPRKLVTRLGDGHNADDRIHAMVHNNIRKKGPVIFAPYETGTGLKKALAMTPAEVIRDVKTARLRGRGGAGFPTGIKWEFTRASQGDRKFVICNGDEGEPGTFKDRVLFTECADMLFEGMTIGGYAIGADTGILYLRGEYAYLKAYLDSVLDERRRKNLLGKNILGKNDFSFDIRIQMGAGAYICGEETALISSCEGRRGDPKNRPPFPAQKGYLGCPTVVNNVETFCCVSRILDKGAGWFAEMGSKGSPGTKLLSVSGDCKAPGVFEVPFGTCLKDVLELAKAEDPVAVQVGGPSGQLVPAKDFGRTICYDDLATGGAIIVFHKDRDLLQVVDYYVEFFLEESCGYCTPCRVGNVLLKERIGKLIHGKGEPGDLEYLKELGETMKTMSRCGLGQTAANPVLTSLANFAELYQARIKKHETVFQPTFDIKAAVADAEMLVGRKSVIFASK
ncbi:MAG: NAD(P)H-dependent oxidoreductase subunit E [Phycisphaerae bacterium]